MLCNEGTEGFPFLIAEIAPFWEEILEFLEGESEEGIFR
jgi:hypothetical protein